MHVQTPRDISRPVTLSLAVAALPPVTEHEVAAPARSVGWRDVVKRVFDLVAATIFLVLVAPTMLLIAALIVLDSPGWPIFVQERVGRDGRPFRLLKFRTMVRDAESQLANVIHLNKPVSPLFKVPEDPRATRVGRTLRRLSLDELPQLWNIIRGDMSLVGPRPALASEMAYWPVELFDRLKVRPGLTGMWQVSGRSDATFEDYINLDLQYVRNWSLRLDTTIIAKTLPAVLRRRGAY